MTDFKGWLVPVLTAAGFVLLPSIPANLPANHEAKGKAFSNTRTPPPQTGPISLPQDAVCVLCQNKGTDAGRRGTRDDTGSGYLRKSDRGKSLLLNLSGANCRRAPCVRIEGDETDLAGDWDGVRVQDTANAKREAKATQESGSKQRSADTRLFIYLFKLYGLLS